MRLKLNYQLLITLFLTFGLISCSSNDDGSGPVDDDDPQEVSPVVFDINAVPYPKLSDYNFFKAPMNGQVPVYGVLPFEPKSPLFTDYAKKKRFVWMPENVSATVGADDQPLNFPTGTVLIKNFYYDNVQPENQTKIIETRLMIMKADGWIFANYIWNDAQTEAFIDTEGAFVQIQWEENGTQHDINYRIPSEAECFQCHYANGNRVPIGPKPQNLNFPINYADGNSNQLQKLKDFGYLSGAIPSNIASVVDYNDTSQSLDMRARSYLDINCGHCHREGGIAELYPTRFNYMPVADYTSMGFCEAPEIDINGMIQGGEAHHIIYPGDHSKSVIFYRMNTNEDNIKMPRVGRSIVHTAAVDLINNWIDSFPDEGCE